MNTIIKQVSQVEVAGVALDVSKVRAGTKCKCCGRPIIDDGFQKTYTKSCAVAYVCNDCIRFRSYGDDLERRAIIGHKLTAGKYRFAIELEACWHDGTRREDIKPILAFLAANYGIQPSGDCTVDVEFHMTNRVNFHGLKDFMQGISEKVNLSHVSCGHHINISKIEWTREDMNKVRENSNALFNELSDTMYRNETGTTKLFGRFFKGYCTYDRSYRHGSWLNLGNRYHLEFRLPHYVSANQFFYCTMFCRDCIDIVDQFIKDEIPVSKASAKMVKTFQKYVDGDAKCQRPEYNKYDR